MTIEAKLKEFDLFDNSIIKHGSCENIRDYELIGYLSGQEFDLEVSYVFEGCIEVNFRNVVAPEYFSMDERLLDLTRQDEPDYPQAFVWGAGAEVYPGWILKENTEKLNNLKTLYQINFSQINIETNAYNLEIVFHNVEITPLKKYEKNVTVI